MFNPFSDGFKKIIKRNKRLVLENVNRQEKGKKAPSQAYMYFFEAFVIVHRAGEGAPCTGLKPA